MKKVLIVVLALLVLGGCMAVLITNINRPVSRNDALEIALQDAGIEKAQAYDIDVDYEHGYYEVSFETGRGDLEYRIDGKTGEILTVSND